MRDDGRGFEDVRGMRLLFVGAGGVSMCSLCLLSARLGAVVYGCDREDGEGLRVLRRAGVSVFVGHRRENVPREIDAVVYSLAIPEDAPELVEAMRRGIPRLSRPVFFGQLMRRFTERIGVSGTHGKSTTTAMLHHIFSLAGRQPTTLCGTSAEDAYAFSDGGRELLIYEGCEYKDAFLSFFPSDLVLLNAEWDHPDYFADEAALLASFRAAARTASQRVVLCADDARLLGIAHQLSAQSVVTFGRQADAYIRYEVTGRDGGRTRFAVWREGERLGEVCLSLLGEYQVQNATAALTEALCCDVPFADAKRALEEFSGIGRRMQCLARNARRTVYYDYAHHPTEIRCSIDALRQASDHPITVVFRPHTYSRTKALFDGFVDALRMADAVYLTDIFAARERPLAGVDAQGLAHAIGRTARYVPMGVLSDAVRTLQGTVVLMGAGDLTDAVRAVCAHDQG